MAAFTVAAQGCPPVRIESGPGRNLVQSIYLSGLFEPPGLCAGLGFCGRCRVRFLPESPHIPSPTPKDARVLSADELAEGWRLGCEHAPAPGCALLLPDFVKARGHSMGEPDAAGNDSAGCGLAVDFGTTSVHCLWEGIGRSQGVACGGSAAEAPVVMVNPQMGSGGDVMSRLAYALEPQGLARLRELSRDSLRALLARRPAGEVCLAANSAMTYIFLGRSVNGLAHAPYSLDYFGGASADLPGLPPVWVCPLIAPFVGGDISAGYAAIVYAGLSGELAGTEPEYPFLLADMGTNGEFLLCLDKGRALATSMPLGPALEGAGLNCGAEARAGVITSFNLGPFGFEPVIQGLPVHGAPDKASAPTGISGTGFISLLQLLRGNGLLDESGRLCRDAAVVSPLGKRLIKGFGTIGGAAGEAAYFVTPELYISAGDVEELLKIRAAFVLGMNALLQSAGMEARGLKAIYLAGSLGLHVSTSALAELGFIPRQLAGIVRSVGNSSLAGAGLLLRRPELRGEIAGWCRSVKSLNLAEHEGFHSMFAAEMHF